MRRVGKNKIAVHKLQLQEFCEAEKRKIFIIIKTLSKHGIHSQYVLFHGAMSNRNIHKVFNGSKSIYYCGARAIFGTALYSACEFVCPFVSQFVRLLVCSHQYVSLIAY
jgi:hypothetical protein